MHDPHDAHLPVDLLAGLLAEGHVGRPTFRAGPLIFCHVVDLLDGLDARVVPPAMPFAAWLLATTTAPLTLVPLDIVARRWLRRLVLLRRCPEHELRQSRHPLRQRGHLTLQIGHPRPQNRVVRLQALGLRPPALGLRPPLRCLVLRGGHDHQHTPSQSSCSVPSEPRWSYGITEYLPPDNLGLSSPGRIVVAPTGKPLAGDTERREVRGAGEPCGLHARFCELETEQATATDTWRPSRNRGT